MATGKLEDYRPPVKLKLAGLWASVMALYIYADYFNLYQPGKIEQIAAGDLGIGPATGSVMMGVAAMMIVPSAMIFLSLVLPPSPNRWLNVLFGAAYSAIVGATAVGAAPFYLLFAAVEIVFTLLVAWFALTWPRQAPAA